MYDAYRLKLRCQALLDKVMRMDLPISLRVQAFLGLFVLLLILIAILLDPVITRGEHQHESISW